MYEQLDPGKGNVSFGSGLHGWGFNLNQFAQMYEDKFKIKKEKLMKRLWGSNFYNPEERKWSKTPGNGYQRGFNLFVWEPIVKVFIILVAYYSNKHFWSVLILVKKNKQTKKLFNVIPRFKPHVILLV